MKMKTLRQILNKVEESQPSMMDFSIRINGFSHQDWYWDAFIEMLKEDEWNLEQEAWFSEERNLIYTGGHPSEYTFEIVKGEWIDQPQGREFNENMRA